MQLSPSASPISKLSIRGGFKDSKFNRLALREKLPIFSKLAQGTDVLLHTKQECYQNFLQHILTSSRSSINSASGCHADARGSIPRGISNSFMNFLICMKFQK